MSGPSPAMTRESYAASDANTTTVDQQQQFLTSFLYRSKRQEWKPAPRRLPPSICPPSCITSWSIPSPTCCRRRLMTPPKRCMSETVPPSPRSRHCCRSTPMRPISPRSASPLAPRPRKCCGCSRQHANDIGLVIRLNAQYGSMVRTSLSVHGRLMRVQALRHKREKIDSAVSEDAWARHVAERSMLEVVDRMPNCRRQPSSKWHRLRHKSRRRRLLWRSGFGRRLRNQDKFQGVAFETSCRRLLWTKAFKTPSQKPRQILRMWLLRHG